MTMLDLLRWRLGRLTRGELQQLADVAWRRYVERMT